MEENNKEETIKQENKTENHCQCRKETIGMLLAAFLGGFLAIYFVADQAFAKNYQTRHFSPDRFERQMIKDFNKMYEMERKAFEKNFGKFDMDFGDKWLSDNKNFAMQNWSNDGLNIKTEIDNDEYKVIIGLKAFDGDESKINYNVAGRKLTIYGNSNVKDKNYEKNISFSNDFLLPENADISKIKKEKKDSVLVIEVPLNK